ncbi:unnamed protein product [Brassica oleracea var. botrytis]
MWAQSGEVLCDTIDAEIRKRWKLKQQPETSVLSGVSIVICQNCRRRDETIQEKPSNRSKQSIEDESWRRVNRI